MKATKKQQKQILELWFCSDLKNSLPNLVMQKTELKNDAYFTIGKYFFDSVTGKDCIEPIDGMEKLSYNEILKLLTNK